MQLKHTIIILTAAELLSAQTYAHEAPLEAPQAALAVAFSQADMAVLVVNTNQPMLLAVLTVQEMRETEGAWLNFANGGAIGLSSYAYNN